MRRISTAVAGLVLALVCAASGARAASHNGRNVDGHWYDGTAANSTYGTHRNVQIEFNGERAYIKFPSGRQIVAILEDEAIVDPHEIVCYDHFRGVSWTLDVLDLSR